MSTPRLVWLDPDKAADFRAAVAREADELIVVSGPAEFAHAVFRLATYPARTPDEDSASPRYLRHQDDGHPTHLYLTEDFEEVTADFKIGSGRSPAAWVSISIDASRIPAEFQRWDPQAHRYNVPEDVDWPSLAIQALEKIVEQINAGFVAVVADIDIRSAVGR